jgi:hypothetical protein
MWASMLPTLPPLLLPLIIINLPNQAIASMSSLLLPLQCAGTIPPGPTRATFAADMAHYLRGNAPLALVSDQCRLSALQIFITCNLYVSNIDAHVTVAIMPSHAAPALSEQCVLSVAGCGFISELATCTCYVAVTYVVTNDHINLSLVMPLPRNQSSQDITLVFARNCRIWCKGQYVRCPW